MEPYVELETQLYNGALRMKFLVPIAAMTLIVLAISPTNAQAQQSADEQSAHLFHNMYTTGPSAQTAAMYPAPHPTPRIAGHVFNTYQPFAPHQMMYEHNRTYYTPFGGPGTFYQDPCANGNCGGYSGQGMNVTTVVWQHGGTFTSPYPFEFRNRFSGQRFFGNRMAPAASGGCSTCQ
jgi:hypothetical protein